MSYFARRAIALPFQLLAIALVTFLLVRLIPGDPAIQILGSQATPDAVAALHEDLGLDQPLPVQFGLYLWRVVQGDFGTSSQSGAEVRSELFQRLPATLELITLGLALSLLVAVPLGVRAALRPRGILGRGAATYSQLAGALPEFWVAVMLIYVFYFKLHLVGAPDGRLDVGVDPPTRITGAYSVDSLLTGDATAFRSAVGHLALPVLTLSIVTSGPLLRMTLATMQEMLSADFTRYARLCGLPERMIARYALRSALPPVVTLTAILFNLLVGGAVLVETVFGWGGAGQYAVQGVLNSDFNVVQAFVLVAALISVAVYVLVDVVYRLIDPRIK